MQGAKAPDQGRHEQRARALGEGGEAGEKES